MEIIYRKPLSLRRLRTESARRWFTALAIALLLEASGLYYAMQHRTSLFTTNFPGSVLTLDPLTLDPLIVAALFPTKVAVVPVSLKSSINRRTALRTVPIRSVGSSPSTIASSPDGSVTISPQAPGSNVGIDVGGVPTSETTGTGTDTTTTGSTPTTSTGTTVSPTNTNINTNVGGTTTSTTTSTSSSGTSTTVSTGTGSTSTSTTITIPTVSVPPVPPVGGGITLP